MTTYSIVPMGKPRMTRADKWKQRPEVLRYRAFCDEVRLRGVSMPDAGSHVTFVLPMPPSWSKKKRAELNGKPHHQAMGRGGPDHHQGVSVNTDPAITDTKTQRNQIHSMRAVHE